MKQNDKDLFEEKSQDWDKRDMVRQISSAVGRTILDNLPLVSTATVMDFGAGTGLISGQIAPLVAQINAVDISQSMLDKLAEKPELSNKVKLYCQDILSQPLNESFDFIVSAMAMHHVADTNLLLHRFRQHLSQNGMIALADLDKEEGDFHPEGAEGVYHHGFDRDELRVKLKSAGFEDIVFHTALALEKEDRKYTIFVVTATAA